MSINLIEELLAEQGRLQTPVARFAADTAHSAPTWAELIPLSAPVPGEQYAFEVDLDSCSGCKACVAACHSMNGLDEHETWRDIGSLVGADEAPAFSQTITTTCHHCEDPACLNGCPVLAFEKDPLTGIVRHLDDQCIGCSYCVLKCPYDVPKYNPARGIVRKCDLCHGRLSHGEAPACVQACPTHAIRIVNVRVTDRAAPVPAFLPGSPDPAYTRPTTRYTSERGLPPNLAAPPSDLQPEPAHWPLVLLLTFLPLAVGSLGAAAAAGSHGGPRSDGAQRLIELATATGIIGLASSVFHLGRPLRAWRVFLGLRRSWLSREAVMLCAWIGLTVAAALVRNSGQALVACAAVTGLAALACSVMVYVDTRREFWRWEQTAPRILGSALLLGLAAAWAFLGPSVSIQAGLALAVLAKLAIEARALKPAAGTGAGEASGRTAQILRGPLRSALVLRVAASFAGGVLAPALAVSGVDRAGVAWLALAGIFCGELAERYLFFRAVIAPRMPGVVRA